MKKYFFLLLFAAQSIYGIAQKSSDNDQPYLTKSLADAAIQNVKVQTSGGSIAVSGGSNGDARVEVYIRGNNGNNDLSKQEIEERLQNYDLSIDVSNHKLTAIAKNKDRNMNWKKSLSISFKIYTPKAVSTDLTTAGGSIKLNDLEGDQSFKTSGGSLKIDNVSGDIDGATSGGSISVTNSHDNINLATSGGSIEAANCNGKLNLATSGGSLRLDDLKGNIKANTSGGSIRGGNIEGTLSAHTSGGSVRLDNLSCSVETSTSGGSMNVQVVKLGEYVRVSNSGGGVDLQLPKGQGLDLHLSGNRVSTSSLSNFSGSVESDNVDGKVNGGGTSVVVKAGSGHVNLSLQ